ncbi:MAG: hypothetical protein ACKO81_05265 [Planctomycetota bacterium]
MADPKDKVVERFQEHAERSDASRFGCASGMLSGGLTVGAGLRSSPANGQ